MVRRVLGHVDGRAAVFAAYRQALQHAQQHQQDGRGDAYAGVAGQQAHQEGGHAHDQDGGEEGVFAAYHIAQPAEQQRAERAHQEAGGEGHQGEDEGGGVIDAGEELLADHRR